MFLGFSPPILKYCARNLICGKYISKMKLAQAQKLLLEFIFFKLVSHFSTEIQEPVLLGSVSHELYSTPCLFLSSQSFYYE